MDRESPVRAFTVGSLSMVCVILEPLRAIQDRSRHNLAGRFGRWNSEFSAQSTKYIQYNQLHRSNQNAAQVRTGRRNGDKLSLESVRYNWAIWAIKSSPTIFVSCASEWSRRCCLWQSPSSQSSGSTKRRNDPGGFSSTLDIPFASFCTWLACPACSLPVWH